MKKVFALMLALCMVLGLCACGSETDPTLLKAAQNMENFNSLSYQMDIDIQGVKDGKPVPFRITADSELMEKEGLMHMDMDMTMADRVFHFKMYKQQEGFSSITCKGMDVGKGLAWTREEGSALKVLSVVPSEDVLKYISRVEATGETRTVNGHTCQKYSGIIAGPNLKVLLKLVSLMGSMGREFSEKMAGSLEQLKVPVELFLDTEEDLILQISLDAGELLRAGGILDDSSMECSSVYFSISYGDFDEIQEILIPQEALDAPLKEEDD